MERRIAREATPCRTLDLWFVIAPWPDQGVEAALRLASHPDGRALILTLAEAERAEKERALAELARLRSAMAKPRARRASSKRGRGK